MTGARKLLVRGGQVYDHDGDVHRPPVADILIEGGDIVAVGPDLTYNGDSSAQGYGDAFVAKVSADGTSLRVLHVAPYPFDRFPGEAPQEAMVVAGSSAPRRMAISMVFSTASGMSAKRAAISCWLLK